MSPRAGRFAWFKIVSCVSLHGLILLRCLSLSFCQGCCLSPLFGNFVFVRAEAQVHDPRHEIPIAGFVLRNIQMAQVCHNPKRHTQTCRLFHSHTPSHHIHSSPFAPLSTHYPTLVTCRMHAGLLALLHRNGQETPKRAPSPHHSQFHINKPPQRRLGQGSSIQLCEQISHVPLSLPTRPVKWHCNMTNGYRSSADFTFPVADEASTAG